MAIFGPSGSGKTTLLLVAAGLLSPDEGAVWFDGRDISQLTEREASIYRLRDLGFVRQSFHLVPGASALDNAGLKLVADGRSPKDAADTARPWLERVGLGRRVTHTPAQLSTGECQRVAIARALVNEPQLLLADEPTGNLDSQKSAEVLQLLREICDERRIPIVLVTHDELATQYVDRACTLRDGRLGQGVPEGVTGRLSGKMP